MNTEYTSRSGKRKGAQFRSSPSDSSLATNLIERKSPRSERSPLPAHRHVITEKNAPLPEGGQAVVFDSSGAKFTVPLAQDTMDGGKVDIQKLIDKKEFCSGQKVDKTENKETFRKNHNANANKISQVKEEIAKKKVVKYLCKNRPLGSSSKRKAESQAMLKATKSTSKIPVPKLPELLTRNVCTQTFTLDLDPEKKLSEVPEIKLSGVQRSTERILYSDGTTSFNQTVTLQSTRSPIIADCQDSIKFRGNQAKLQCGDQLLSKEFPRTHVKSNISKHMCKSESSVPLHMRDTINVRNFVRSRTPQRYSLVDPIRCKVAENNNAFCRGISKINKNGILRRTLTMVLFTVILSWFLSAVFRVNIPGDLFRLVVNYLSRLPIFVKRRKRELTKAEIAFKCIGSFLKLLASVFGDSS